MTLTEAINAVEASLIGDVKVPDADKAKTYVFLFKEAYYTILNSCTPVKSLQVTADTLTDDIYRLLEDDYCLVKPTLPTEADVADSDNFSFTLDEELVLALPLFVASFIAKDLNRAASLRNRAMLIISQFKQNFTLYEQ